MRSHRVRVHREAGRWSPNCAVTVKKKHNYGVWGPCHPYYHKCPTKIMNIFCIMQRIQQHFRNSGVFMPPSPPGATNSVGSGIQGLPLRRSETTTAGNNTNHNHGSLSCYQCALCVQKIDLNKSSGWRIRLSSFSLCLTSGMHPIKALANQYEMFQYDLSWHLSSFHARKRFRPLKWVLSSIAAQID